MKRFEEKSISSLFIDNDDIMLHMFKHYIDSDSTRFMLTMTSKQFYTFIHKHSEILNFNKGKFHLMHDAINHCILPYIDLFSNRWSFMRHFQEFSRKAAQDGNLESLKYLKTKGYSFDHFACSSAAQFGHIEVLKWLKEKGLQFNEFTCAFAAGGNQLDTLKWLRKNGCPWDRLTCDYAARNGHLSIIKWARANGCFWGPVTCYNAAGEGHLEVLQWLIASGCPFSKQSCLSHATKKERTHVVGWLISECNE